MNVRNFIAAAVAGLMVFVLAADATITTYTWTGGTATTPAAAKEFANDGNWDTGEYPNRTNIWADVASAAGSYLSLTNTDVTMLTLKNGGSSSSVKLVGTKNLILACTLNDNCWGWLVDLYTPTVISNGVAFLRNVNVCDDFTTVKSGNILAHGGTVSFRDDYWAKSGGNIDRTAQKIASASAYSGTYYFRSPRAAATTGSFALTKGSVYASLVGSGKAETYCSGGQLVTGGGTKAGTYVKRILGSTWIELSEPATETLASSALSFAARTVKVRRSYSVMGHNGAATELTANCSRTSEDEDYAVEIDTLNLWMTSDSGHKRNTTITSDSTLLPGKFILHNTAYPGAGKLNNLTLGRSFLEFGATTYHSSFKAIPQPGLPWTSVTLSSGAQADISAPSGIAATIPHFLSFQGSLVKLGDGSLSVGFQNACTFGASAAIVVKEGSLTFVDADSASAPIAFDGALTVKAGGTFVVPSQGVRITSLSAEAGATFAGTGTVSCTRFDLPAGVTFGPGVKLAPADGASTALSIPAPATKASLPGDPAFWVDLTDQSTLTLVDLDESQWVTVGSSSFTNTFKQGVYRINDVRKQTEDDKYLFSTNVCGNAPTAHMPLWMWDKRKNMHHAFFKGNCISGGNPTGSITNTDAHAWSKPVSNIRLVFQVYGADGSYYSVSGAMPFLGATSLERLQTVQSSDTAFTDMKASLWGRYSSTRGYCSWATPAMKAGEFHVNGTLTELANDSVKPPYGSPLNVGDGQTHKWNCHPLVTDLTIPDTYDANGKRYAHIADAYTFTPGYSGATYVNETAKELKRLYELIVYTNMLTKSEIASVRRYLMRKWLSQDASVTLLDLNDTRADAANGPFEVAAGEALYADSVADGATLTKTGAGTFHLQNAVAPGASVTVAAGTFEVRSYDASTPALTEDDLVAVHLDASDKSNFTYSYDESRGVNTVTKWKDVKTTSGAANDFSIWQSASTNKPFIAENALNGLSVLDFGKFYEMATSEGTAIANSAPVMTPKSLVYDCHAMVGIWGSANGGGTLCGEVGTYWSYGKGLGRKEPGCGASASDVIARWEEHQSLQNTSSYLCRLNGTKINPTETGLSGAYDLFSYAAWCQFELNALQAMDNDKLEWMGGGQIGELIIFRMAPSASHLDEIEAYFRKKWFDTETVGFREATLGSVTVASGATLEVTGGAPLSVKSLAVAGGTVTGDIVLLADAELTVTVNADGSVTPISVDGSLDISKGGTVKFAGAPGKLGMGPHVLARGIGSATADAWQVDVSTLRKKYRRGATLYVEGGNLCLRLQAAGFVFTVQ